MSVKPAELTIRPQEPVTEPFLPGDFFGATTQVVQGLSRPLHTLICQYGYEILPRDLIGRVEVTFKDQKRWLFIFQAERMQKVFQAVIAFGQDPETSDAMRNCILLALHTTYQPLALSQGAPLDELFKKTTPFREFDGQLIERRTRNFRLNAAQTLIIVSSENTVSKWFSTSPSPEQQKLFAAKTYLDENRLFCGSVDESEASLAHEDATLYQPLVVQSSDLTKLSIAPLNENPQAGEQDKAQGK